MRQPAGDALTALHKVKFDKIAIQRPKSCLRLDGSFSLALACQLSFVSRKDPARWAFLVRAHFNPDGLLWKTRCF
jgi:hypothetical protein